MARLNISLKYIILSGIITISALFCVWKWENTNFCSTVLIIYLIFLGFLFGKFVLPQEKNSWQIFWGILSIIGIILILLSGIYWFYGINKIVVSIVLIILPLLVGLLPNKEMDLEINFDSEITPPASYFIPILSFLAGDALLLFAIISRRFGDTLISPWTLFGPRFFILFFLTSALLLFIVQKNKTSKSNLFLIIIHYLLIITVALIVYKHGFGFDSIIHQATEKWIDQNGFISPKQPYYIGQYMLVVFLKSLTHLSIAPIDKVLVPIISPIVLPLVTYFSFSRSQLSKNLFPALTTITLIPLTFFTFTTPNNLALLCALVLFFWIWYEWKNNTKKTFIVGLILSLTAISIHPFIGLPILLIYLGSVVLKKYKHPLFLISYFLFLTLILPLTFTLNSIRTDQAIAIQNPLAHLTPFFTLFQKPHYWFLENAPLAWQLLYYYKFALIPFIVIVAITGFLIKSKHNRPSITDHRSFFYLTTIISLFLSAFLLATTINYADVIGYEQNVFAKRLLELILILILPFFIIALQKLFSLVSKKTSIQLAISILMSILILISFYFTYPTRDPVSLYTGYNVREADIETVHFIDNQNNDIKNYIVLTNQTVSATALQEFGFAKYFDTTAGEQYFYSIPTGGPLYQYFRKMVYEEPIKKYMVEAMDFMGVDTAYFVHTNYWAPASEIRDVAKVEADRWWEIAGGRVWVYKYVR